MIFKHLTPVSEQLDDAMNVKGKKGGRNKILHLQQLFPAIIHLSALKLVGKNSQQRIKKVEINVGVMRPFAC